MRFKCAQLISAALNRTQLRSTSFDCTQFCSTTQHSIILEKALNRTQLCSSALNCTRLRSTGLILIMHFWREKLKYSKFYDMLFTIFSAKIHIKFWIFSLLMLQVLRHLIECQGWKNDLHRCTLLEIWFFKREGLASSYKTVPKQLQKNHSLFSHKWLFDVNDV